MTHLYFAITVMLVVSSVVFLLTARNARGLTSKLAAFVGLAIVGFLFLHAFVLIDNVSLTRFFPTPNAIVYANFLPLGVAALAALLWTKGPPSLYRRVPLVLILLGLGLHRSYAPLVASPPDLGNDKWRDNVCRQTTQASCSAAAAATLLRTVGITGTESEMAILCLTSDRGTSMLGLYRGLSLKTANTPYKVAVFKGTFDDFQRARIAPALPSVGLRSGTDLDPRYQRDWGWAPGVKHSIVYFGPAPQGKVDIGDPSVGREHWFTQGLQDLWYGEALYLTRR